MKNTVGYQSSDPVRTVTLNMGTKAHMQVREKTSPCSNPAGHEHFIEKTAGCIDSRLT